MDIRANLRTKVEPAKNLTTPNPFPNSNMVPHIRCALSIGKQTLTLDFPSQQENEFGEWEAKAEGYIDFSQMGGKAKRWTTWSWYKRAPPVHVAVPV